MKINEAKTEIQEIIVLSFNSDIMNKYTKAKVVFGKQNLLSRQK